MEDNFEITVNGAVFTVASLQLTGRDVKALVNQDAAELFVFVEDVAQAVEDEAKDHCHHGARYEVRERKHHYIDIEIDGVTYRTDRLEQTGAQIKALAKVPEANVLYHVTGGHRVEIADTQRIHLHENECFMTQPPVGGAS